MGAQEVVDETLNKDANGGLAWFAGDPTFDFVLTRTLRSIDGIIFGRKAHEMGASYWPGAGEAGAGDPELADQVQLMNALSKYVLTHGKETSAWATPKRSRSTTSVA